MNEKIQAATAPEKADLKEVLGRIGEVLDRSIEGVNMMREGPPAIDLSRIDFGALPGSSRHRRRTLTSNG